MSDRAKPWMGEWKPYLSAWTGCVELSDDPEHIAVVKGCRVAEAHAYATLAAAAPGLARALCRVEWEGSLNPSGDPACPECRCPPQAAMGASGLYPGGHAPDCPVDAWLTAAGLTAEDREEVRRG